MKAEPRLPRQSVEAAEAFVRQRTGLVFGESRRSSFAAGLTRAMHRSKESSAERYLSLLETQSALLDDLVGEITVGETFFFREPAQFAVIRDEILPALRSGRSFERPLRVWSAGCATGEEPYSLAIVLREQQLGKSAHVIATDLSRSALAAARRGSYTRWSLRGVPETVTHQYFDRTGDRFQLATSVREAVEFRYLNLAEDAYPSLSTGIWGMDLVLCRNVLIYFDAETIARVAGRLIDSLSDQGWLLLGASDPALGDLVDCEVVVTASGLAYRRHGNDPVRTSAALPHTYPLRVPEPVAFQPPPLPPAIPFEAELQEPSPEASVDRLSLAIRAHAERDYARAAALAAEIVGFDGSDPRPWVVLVRALANRGELEAAGRACAGALDSHREFPELVYLHAVLLAEAGLYSDAASAARRALYLDRKLVVGHLLLGGALARLGEIEGARRAVGNAQRLLAELAPDAIVPASDGEAAGRLAEMARVQLELLREAAA